LQAGHQIFFNPRLYYQTSIDKLIYPGAGGRLLIACLPIALPIAYCLLRLAHLLLYYHE